MKNKKIKLEEVTKDIIRERMRSFVKQGRKRLEEVKKIMRSRGYDI